MQQDSTSNLSCGTPVAPRVLMSADMSVGNEANFSYIVGGMPHIDSPAHHSESCPIFIYLSEYILFVYTYTMIG